MKTFWIYEKGVCVFRNFILNMDMAEEVRDTAERRSRGNNLFNFSLDRRGEMRDYYEIPTEEQFRELLTHV